MIHLDPVIKELKVRQNEIRSAILPESLPATERKEKCVSKYDNIV